ncbi:MAG: hypothetical protein HQ519_17630 [Planctomycetes bacterium]|nr:hypothetical protein [Planctomycetota bacterium]
MKKLLATIALVISTSTGISIKETTAPSAVVGTYDSRAIAIAFIRSEQMSSYLQKQMADFGTLRQRAVDQGDHGLVQSLDELGPAMQRKFHEQGFSGAPIDDILATIESRLPAIAKEAGVDLILSRWEIDYRTSSAQALDITELIAAEFKPNEATLKAMHEIMQTEIVPANQLKSDD